jgi:TetR/AcrR family transcriptional regulator, transcriptional repressor of bet genes
MESEMPKVVDHDERRREIATAVSDIAATRGLSDVSFREVAARAGVSVSLVQHYFGDKENLLMTTLEIQSTTMNVYIGERLAGLGADPEPIDVLRTVARAFLPIDEVSRRSMLVYHGFAAAALTDPALRANEMFSNGRGLIAFFATQLSLIRTDDERRHLATADATGLLSLLLGLSIAVLLEQTTADEAIAVLDAHLDRLTN